MNRSCAWSFVLLLLSFLSKWLCTSSVSMSTRSTPSRHRNSRSLPEWIDAALYDFIHSGNHLVVGLSAVDREKNFAMWYGAESAELKAKRKEAIKNRFKYLRKLHQDHFHRFMQGYNDTTAGPPTPPPAMLSLPPTAMLSPLSPPTTTPPRTTPTSSPFTPPTAVNPNEGGGDTDRSRVASCHFELHSNSSSARRIPTETTMASTSMRGAISALDFETPENNPKGLLILRNRNFNINNMTVDKVEAIWALHDIRDAIHTEATIGNDSTFNISEPRYPAYVRANIADCHFGDDADPVCRLQHEEAMRRMRANRNSYRHHTFSLPAGVSIRTSPFSPHPTQVLKVFKETEMDYGEVGDDDLPVLHDTAWVKFVFAINRPTDTDTKVDSVEINRLANRFGNNFGM